MMRNTRCQMLSLLVILAAASSCWCEGPQESGKPPVGENLLANGGFEDGLLHWSTLNIQLEDSADTARSGNACCRGSVPFKLKFGRLRQTVALEPGAEYEVRFWARSDGGPGGWVWADRPDRRCERQVLHVREIPEQWTEYGATFRAKKANTVLDFDLPQSWQSEGIGTAWIDDISLRKTDSPLEQPAQPWAQEALAPDEAAFDPEGASDDQPSLASGPDGRLYLCWLRSTGEHQDIAVRALDGGKWSGRADLTSTKARRQAPAMAVSEQGAWVVWSEENEAGDWDLVARQWKPGRLSAPLIVASGSGNNSCPAVAVDRDGNPWFAWQTTRNKRWGVVVRNYETAAQNWGKEMVLSDHTGSGQYPAIAADHRGTVWAAWSAYVGNGYQLWVRSVGGTAGVGEPKRLDLWRQDNTHATFAAGPDRLWLAWNTSSQRSDEYDYGGTWNKAVAVACTDGETWYLPPGWEKPDTPPGRIVLNEDEVTPAYRAGIEMPRLLCTDSGAPVLMSRHYFTPGVARDIGYAALGQWDARCLVLQADGWVGVKLPFGRGGWPSRIAAAADASGRIWIAQQEDNRSPGGYFECFDGDSWVCVRRLSDLPESGDWRKSLKPAPELAVAETVPSRAERPRRTITYSGKTYTLYWGDLHVHTDRSLCGRNWNGYRDDNLKSCYYAGQRDFAALTDHGKHMNIHDWSGETAATAVNYIPNVFVTFAAVEWTSQMVGHKNVIFKTTDAPLVDAIRNPVLDLWSLLTPGQAITIPHHPADFTHPSDWDYHDPRFGPVAEMYQVRGSFEYLDAPGKPPRESVEGAFVRDALDRGYRFGFIASPDHNGTYGVAAVYATELTREAIFEALLARRCYGAVQPTAFLDVRVDGHLMGEVIAAEPRRDPHRITVKAEAESPIASLTVFRNGEVLHEFQVSGTRADVEFVDEHPDSARAIGDPPQRTVYYYVRLIEEGPGRAGRPLVSWSSPVWITLEPEPRGLSDYKTWSPADVQKKPLDKP